MDNHIWLVIFIVVLAAAALLFLFRRRDRGVPPQGRPPQPLDAPLEGQPGAASAATPSGAAAVEARREFVVRPAPAGPGDDLTRMKGIGPKLAALLAELGVTHYSQIAEWTGEDIAAIDPHLGAFQGRPTRDRWVEQAGYLARDDIAGFEAQFGKLG